MSDFDGPLERLLLDPEFKAALAANPDRILAGYHLDPEQRRVLLTQVSTETGNGLKVEERISKAGMAGLLSAFSEGAGGGMAQHTMKGVHVVAPTSAHGATISAGAAGGPDEAFNTRYPHLDHYKSADAQGTRFYDDQGTPAQPGTGRAVRGAAPPRPGRARRRHRDRAPAGSLTVPVRE